MNNNKEVKNNEVVGLSETKFKPGVDFWGNKI